MKLNSLIFHYIDTKQHQKDVNIKYNEKIYTDTDNLAKKFALELTDNFHKRAIQRAKFDNSADTKPQFEQILNQYQKSKNFLQFSKDALSILKKKMENTPLSVGGIIVFGDIATNNNSYIFIALLNQTEKFAFDEKTFDLKEVEILENEKLAVAAFININKYQNEPNKHYISFIKGLREIANYFTDFLEIGDDKITPAQQTTQLIKALKEYFKTKNIPENEKQSIFSKLYDTLYRYANDKKEISIDTISRLIDEDNPDDFRNFAQSPDSQFQLNSIELLDKNKLKTLINFKFSGEGITISFDKDKYLDKIEVKDDKIILNNPPKKLIEELRNEKNND